MRRIVMLVICVFSALVFLACAGILLHYRMQDRSDARVRSEVAALRPDDLPPGASGTDGSDPEGGDPAAAFADLLAANPDTVGWLRIDGTEIDDVVMYAPQQEDKYLHLDFYGNYSVRGTYYIEEDCNVQTSDNLIIYGHHMKDGTMFGALADYQKADFAAAHPTIRFRTIYGDRTYEIVAAINTRMLAEGEPGFRYYQYTGTNDDVQFWQYDAFIRQNRLYDTGVELQPGDKLLTLSTCAYHTQDGRFIVVARQVN